MRTIRPVLTFYSVSGQRGHQVHDLHWVLGTSPTAAGDTKTLGNKPVQTERFLHYYARRGKP